MQFLLNAPVRSHDLTVRLTVGAKEHFVVEEGKDFLVLGYGKKEEMSLRNLRILIRRAVYVAKGRNFKSLVLNLSEWNFPKLRLEEEELTEMLGVNILLSNYAFTTYKTPPQEGFINVERVNICQVHKKVSVTKSLQRAKVIGEEVNLARSIANTPAGDMTPHLLTLHAKKSIRKLPIKLTIFNEKRLVQEKMMGIIAVGKGSEAAPRFMILEYRGGKANEQATVLVGKGVTFDSGGINLKPSDSILGMNMDMSGAASVLHTLVACARLKAKKNIIVLIPAVENMISGRSYRPGDIIRTASGKTIEVQNTDAEGRIIMADALHYAKRFNPGLVIDVATLTGAAMAALGERAAALFTEDEKLEKELRHIGTNVGDPVWPLPLWDEYAEDIKGTYADIGNVGITRYGGAITAALFLKQFVDYPWVHIDIAPRMVANAGETLAKGSLGAGVQLLTHFLLKKD